MICARVALLLFALVTARADDLHQRLLHFLGPEAGPKNIALLKEGKFSEVEANVAQATAGNQQLQSEQRALCGILEFMNGQMDSALQAFQQAGKWKPLVESDRFTLAMAFVRLGRHDDARTELNQLAAREPNKAIYPYWLGRIDYDQRRYDAAVVHLKQAIELDPKSARAWDSLGLAYDMQGHSDDALQALEQGARFNRQQEHPSAWPPHDLGALLLRMGQTKQAEAAFREALQSDPQMEQAHYHLGRALEKDGADEEAVNEYLTAIKEDTKSADVCYSLALLYRKLHRDQDASAMFAEWRKRRDAQQ